jgi:lysyl-tRNA synthetase class I
MTSEENIKIKKISPGKKRGDKDSDVKLTRSRRTTGKRQSLEGTCRRTIEVELEAFNRFSETMKARGVYNNNAFQAMLIEVTEDIDLQNRIVEAAKEIRERKLEEAARKTVETQSRNRENTKYRP